MRSPQEAAFVVLAHGDQDLMNDIPAKVRFTRSTRFALAPRGFAAEAEYRLKASGASGPRRRVLFEQAREGWAAAHGLGLDDGAYLLELALGSQSLTQLGEGLAICSQTREMVADTLQRLIASGLVVQHAANAPERRASAEMADAELMMAELSLDSLVAVGTDGSVDDAASEALRRARARVDAARSFAESMSTAC